MIHARRRIPLFLIAAALTGAIAASAGAFSASRAAAPAGSIFKNPPGEYAGRLIEAEGLKGRRIGGAMISEQHANFIVNVGDAKAADVKQLMDEIAETVWRSRAIRLVPEIKLVGDWES
jgi:UDP-N-acetylmuramate dehydrogenase